METMKPSQGHHMIGTNTGLPCLMPRGGKLTTSNFEEAAWEALVKRVVNGANEELRFMPGVKQDSLSPSNVLIAGHLRKGLSLPEGGCRKGSGGWCCCPALSD